MAAVTMNQKLFQDLTSQGSTVLVEFWAPWCTYCRRISAAYEKVAEQNSDHMVVAKVNIDDEGQLAEQERIEVVPTLVLYRDGKALGSIVAPESKAMIDNFIEETLSKA